MNAVKTEVPVPLPAQGQAARRPLMRAVPESAVVRLPQAGRLTHPLPTPARREHAIRDAAYFHWAYRGCVPGGAVADWLEAEREVDEQLALRDTLIREAAYARWQKGGRNHGHDVEDWVAAEAEVDANLAGRGILCGL